MVTQIYRQPLDIANRAMQHIGDRLLVSMDPTVEDRRAVQEVANCYDKLRQAELRRNVWRFSIRRARLQVIDPASMLVQPADYDATKTYPLGSLVRSTLDDRYYIARALVPLNEEPSAASSSLTRATDYWEPYFGPQTCSPYNSGTTYDAGEIVYSPASPAYAMFLSLINANATVPSMTPPAYDPTIAYEVGDTVVYSATTYQSKIDLNLAITPGTDVTKWDAVPASQVGKRIGQQWLYLAAGATLSSLKFSYPLGAGPVTDRQTLNVFRLPSGFIREAPQDPKAGSQGFLGGPNALPYTDFQFEGDYIVTRQSYPMLYRFVADVTDVRQMDAMFCEGLAARIALETCEAITQSGDKLTTIAQVYKLFMGEARTVNGIERGPTESPEDEYVSVRW